MSRAECLRDHASTGLQKGVQRNDGHYYRCLRADDVRRLYRDDEGRYGYRVRPEKWRWSDSDQEGLSVTEAVCARNPSCAIYFHPRPEQFEHVVKINLQALAEAIGVTLAAVFDPLTESPENPCHFVIVPTDVSIDDLLVSLGEFMADDFPPGPKQPRRDAGITAAERAREQYDSVFAIVLRAKDVR